MDHSSLSAKRWTGSARELGEQGCCFSISAIILSWRISAFEEKKQRIISALSFRTKTKTTTMFFYSPVQGF